MAESGPGEVGRGAAEGVPGGVLPRVPLPDHAPPKPSSYHSAFKNTGYHHSNRHQLPGNKFAPHGNRTQLPGNNYRVFPNESGVSSTSLSDGGAALPQITTTTGPNVAETHYHGNNKYLSNHMKRQPSLGNNPHLTGISQLAWSSRHLKQPKVRGKDKHSFEWKVSPRLDHTAVVSSICILKTRTLAH